MSGPIFPTELIALMIVLGFVPFRILFMFVSGFGPWHCVFSEHEKV